MEQILPLDCAINITGNTGKNPFWIVFRWWKITMEWGFFLKMKRLFYFILFFYLQGKHSKHWLSIVIKERSNIFIEKCWRFPLTSSSMQNWVPPFWSFSPQVSNLQHGTRKIVTFFYTNGWNTKNCYATQNNLHHPHFLWLERTCNVLIPEFWRKVCSFTRKN